MPRVPTLDSFQVAENTLPQVRFSAPNMPDIAGQQTQQMSRGMMQTGQVMGQVAIDMQQQANQLRVDQAMLQADEVANRLSFDKEIGFANIKGENALNRPNGKPITEEYSEKINNEFSAIASSLGNEQQRMQFQQRSNRISTGFRNSLVKHEASEYKSYSDSVDDASVANRKMAIGNNYSDPVAIDNIINGIRNDQGTILEPGIRQFIERKAVRNGLPKEWIDAQVSIAVSDAHKDVAVRMMDDDPIKAFNYIKSNSEKLGDHYPSLIRSARPAYDRQVGIFAGEKIRNKVGPVSADADGVIDWVIKIEGGYVSNDAGKGETKYGINKTANPDVDIKNLTPEQAREIYRDRYWKGIGADRLPKEIRAIAFDTAVNQGVSMANKLTAASGGDPEKYIDLRRAEYARLIESNPAKFKRYEKSWNNRLDELSSLAYSGGERSLTGQLREAERTIEDPEQRRSAMAHIREQNNLDMAEKKEAYQSNFSKSLDIAYSKPGGWRDIPPSMWAQIDRDDREKLMVIPKKSDPDTLLMLKENPQLWKAGSIENYRPLLSEGDYIDLHNRGNGPNAEAKIREAKIDSEQFSNELNAAGLGDMLNAKKGSPGQASLLELKAKFEQVIDAEQTARGKSLSMDEKNKLLRSIIKPVKVAQVRTGSFFGMFDGESSDADMRAYQVKNPANIRIPNDIRSRIIGDMQRLGIAATEQRIRDAYLAMEEKP